MIIRYFKCPVCGKTTPLDSLQIPEGEGLFTIQEREAAGRYGFPTVGEYDVVDSDEDDEDLISSFAERVEYLYEKLLELGYLSQDSSQDSEVNMQLPVSELMDVTKVITGHTGMSGDKRKILDNWIRKKLGG